MKIVYLICNLFIFVFAISKIGTCQNSDNLKGFGTELNLFEGKVIKHTIKFHLPVPDISTGADINFQWKTYGKRDWEQRRRYPIVGIGFAYTNYGIDSIYGRCIGLYPNLVIPLITGKHLEWTLRIGNGVGYVTKDYSRMPPMDTINNAIGSHINDYASFMTDIRYHVNKHWDFQIGANFSHISDASYHQPNLGINLAGAHVGVKYFPISSNPEPLKRSPKPIKNRWLLQFRLSMGYNQTQAPLGPLYPIYITTGYISKKWKSKNKLFFGGDCSYHETIYSLLRTNPSLATPGTEASLSYKGSIIAGNEFMLGRVGVVLQMGYYVRQSYQFLAKYYEKIGGNLYIINKEHGPIKELFICANLKTHLGTAEFTELGFGMGF